MGLKDVLPIALAAALVAPGSAFADRKDGEKQRRERSEREYRDADRRARDGYYEGDYDRASPGAYGRDQEWRQAEKERDKEAREAWREAEKDRREAEREWEKDRREARKHGRHRDYPYDRRY